ncbi:MAG: tRNA (adenosine(37)-N6)-dimethylallyltransferase MiaA [Coprobacillus sp.]|nr:tRNA (adenosine(37)-N6)-dimethylallyltransferase MiaA [Coprobacillus sp.]
MIYVIVGPTGSGKSEIAHTLSERKNAPIINADAFQIYKDMDIGTAKISKDNPYYSRYYLLDIITPSETFSVRDYQLAFRSVLEELLKTHKDIIVVGGTGLYIKAALYDFTFPKEGEPESYDQLSNQEIYDILKEKDPESLKTIHVNNRKRLVRALNILNHGEVTKSENIKSQSHSFYRSDIEVKFLFINPERKVLYEHIDERVEQMFDNGLVREVEGLLKTYTLSSTSSQAIGYKEVISYLNKTLNLEETKELIKQRTRNYAKRQVTYFRHQLPCQEYQNASSLLEDVK